MSFRLAHLSDLHLGYRTGTMKNAQGINLREADVYMAFSEIVTDVINTGVDAVMVAGDTFHKPNPKTNEIVFAQNQFRRLADAGIPVYVLAGNHDCSDIQEEVAASRVINDPARGIYSHAEPYVKHEIADGIHLHLVSHHMYADQIETMQKVHPVEGDINIFSTHGSVIDPLLNEKLRTEQSPREIVIPDFLLNDQGWDYTLLGHIHERGWIGSSTGAEDALGTKVYYNGSSVRRGFADKECELGRGWTLWEIDENGLFTPTIRTIRQRPQHDFPVIDAADLSAGEVSEIIIDRLKATQLEDMNQSLTAPILRQKIVNMTPAKRSALDWKTIDANQTHAMHWDTPIEYMVNDLRKNADETHKSALEENTTSDMAGLYDAWVSSSSMAEQISANLREDAINRARRFIEQGQDATLDLQD